jgi:transcriptional regulator with XRE-family HTH domain
MFTMGYRGKVREQERARALRARGWVLDDIARRLDVSKSSVSLWVRDVAFQPRLWRRGGGVRPPNALQRRKAAEIERFRAEGRERVDKLSEREFLVAGAALYAGEGSKDKLKFTNTNEAMVRLYCAWLRQFFTIDESRLRCQLYLHQGLDLTRATRQWSDVTGIPVSQFWRPYRAKPDASIRRAKHPYGCANVVYLSSTTHRAVMGVVGALLTCDAIPG